MHKEPDDAFEGLGVLVLVIIGVLALILITLENYPLP